MRKSIINEKLSNINSVLAKRKIAAEFSEVYIDIDKVNIYLEKGPGTEKVLVAKELAGVPAELFLTDVGRMLRILPAWEVKTSDSLNLTEKSVKELEDEMNVLWERFTGYRKYWEVQKKTVKGKGGTVLLLTDEDTLRDENDVYSIVLSLVRVLNAIRVKVVFD